MRQYDADLVERIRSDARYENHDGLQIMVKPVPDVGNRRVFDPRIVSVLERKRELSAKRAGVGYRLSFERDRPDKISYDLVQRCIEMDERLIEIDGDHLIDVYTYRPASKEENLPVVVYLHGGGFTAGNERLFRNQMRLIAERANAVVVFPEYRLAPENPFPAPVRDAFGTVCWARDHAAELGGDSERIMVAGDSAGGSLACACALLDEDNQARTFEKLFLVYPLCDKTDPSTQTEYIWSYDDYEVEPSQHDLMVERVEKLRANACSDPQGRGNLYLQGKTAPSDPLVSSAFATDEQLSRFPRTVIATAEYDYLRVGAEYLTRRLMGLGVDTAHIRYQGCDHGFIDLLGICPQAEELCQSIADELLHW